MHKLFRNTHIQLFLIILLAVLLRGLVHVFFPSVGSPDSMDAMNYNRIAFQIMDGEGFAMYGHPTVFVAPLLPYFLAGVYLIFGVHFWVVKALFILLAAVSTLLVYMIGRELLSPKLGIAAALFFAVEPSLCAIPAFIYTEPLNIPLLLTAVYVLIRGIKSDKTVMCAVAGALMGLATLCKGTTLYFPVFLFGFTLLIPRFRPYWKRMLVFFAVFFLTLVPWTVRNYVTFHTFLPIATGAGESLWTGNYLPFDGEFRYRETQKKASELTRGLSWIERDRKLGQEARKMIFDHPGPIALLSIKKIYRFWIKGYKAIPTGKARTMDWSIYILLSTVQILAVTLAVWGIFRYPQKDLFFWMIFLIFIYFTLVHTVTLSVPRFRIPVMPFLLIFSAMGLFNLIAVFQKKLKD